MGSLQQDPSGHWHACFRFAGKRFKRSLHTKSESKATALLGRIEDNIELVHRGVLSIPEGSDIPTFLVSDGQLNTPVQLTENLSLTQLIDRYGVSMPKGAMEESTRYTIRVHTGHLKEVLGADFSVKTLTRDDLRRYINARAKKKGQRGKPLSPVTIRKEITTLSGIWSWAITAGLVGPFPNKGLKYPKVSEKPPFQTWKEIEKQIGKGGLSDEEQAQLWDCLFRHGSNQGNTFRVAGIRQC